MNLFLSTVLRYSTVFIGPISFVGSEQNGAVSFSGTEQSGELFRKTNT